MKTGRLGVEAFGYRSWKPAPTACGDDRCSHALCRRSSGSAGAQRNRIERDRLLAIEVVEQAEALGLRVIHVDGEGGPAPTLALVEEHFRPYLPAWIY